MKTKINKLILFLALYSIMLNNVTAWWDEGHLLVSRIAYDILKAHEPEVLE